MHLLFKPSYVESLRHFGLREAPVVPYGTVSYVPGGWAHRSVNVGAEPLVFFAAYVGDAGHDYDTVERTGFPVLIVAGDDGPEVVANPRYRR